MTRRRRSMGLAAGIVIAGLLLLTPALAGASTALISGGQLRFIATAGETNDVTLSFGGGNFVLDDAGAPITPMFGCVAVNANRATCPAALVDDGIDVDLGDLDDRALLAASVPEQTFFVPLDGAEGNDSIRGLGRCRIRAFGGPGNDTLAGGSNGDRLEGQEGDDTAAGNEGNDQFTSDPGTDRLDGGPGFDQLETGPVPDGADTFIGGPDPDEVSYRDRLGPVTVSLDGVANDGESGEGDNIGADVESVAGGPAPDRLTGNGSDNEISGDRGSDSIVGGGGDDQLDGGPGNDNVSGGSGDDSLEGGTGSDSVAGEAGSDALGFEGSDGLPDQINGGAGLDTFSGYSLLGLKIDLDGTADDGYRSPIEGEANDNVGADIENLELDGKGDDALTGNNAANQIEGGPGNDQISGLGGPDALLGEAGEDQIDGGEGVDLLDGAGGVDRLRSRDASPDEVSCGSSADTLLADSLDEFGADCDQSSAGVAIKGSTAKLNRRGKAGLRVVCPALEGIDCKVKLTATQGKKTLAKGGGKVNSGQTGKVTIKLTKAGKKRRAKRLAVKIRTTFTDAAGAPVTTTVPKLVLKR